MPERTQLGPRDRSRRERLRDSPAEAHDLPTRRTSELFSFYSDIRDWRVPDGSWESRSRTLCGWRTKRRYEIASRQRPPVQARVLVFIPPLRRKCLGRDEQAQIPFPELSASTEAR